MPREPSASPCPPQPGKELILLSGEDQRSGTITAVRVPIDQRVIGVVIEPGDVLGELPDVVQPLRQDQPRESARKPLSDKWIRAQLRGALKPPRFAATPIDQGPRRLTDARPHMLELEAEQGKSSLR